MALACLRSTVHSGNFWLLLQFEWKCELETSVLLGHAFTRSYCGRTISSGFGCARDDDSHVLSVSSYMDAYNEWVSSRCSCVLYKVGFVSAWRYCVGRYIWRGGKRGRILWGCRPTC